MRHLATSLAALPLSLLLSPAVVAQGQNFVLLPSGACRSAHCSADAHGMLTAP
jgi:hypothetical protein